ncbi:hypothetical protein CHS0354_004586 [Potamilus streckersoni]|uniref:Uncharacterized protein n=1 Tax=Potamilus streckersoni TaxID=2493646 RepID=A0AAE0VPQ2_9BIVA|nr:hypothetical protein CHS0354_004586 [Potamilus streckersoni]
MPYAMGGLGVTPHRTEDSLAEALGLLQATQATIQPTQARRQPDRSTRQTVFRTEDICNKY